MKQCPTCKKTFHDSATQCEPCGCRLRGYSGYGKWALIAISLIAALLVIYLFAPRAAYRAYPFAEIIDSQLIALRTGDIDKAYSHLANETTASISPHKFQSYINSYPIIKNNQGMTVSQASMTDDTGYVRGTLKNNENKDIRVEYTFIKEHGQWEIAAMHLMESTTDTLPEGQSPTYIHNHYTISYPQDWTYEDSNKATVNFYGKAGTPSTDSSVTIQVLFSKKNGGTYQSPSDVIHDLKNQISTQAQSVTFTDAGLIELPTDPHHIQGNYFIASYSYQGNIMKKMQFVLGDEKGAVFYAWSFTAKAEQFDKDLPIAKAMFESWKLED